MSKLDRYSWNQKTVDVDRKKLDERIRLLEAEKEENKKVIEKLQKNETPVETHQNTVPEIIPQKETETVMTSDDEDKVMSRYMKRQGRIKKRERRMILGKENEGVGERQNFVLYLALGGLGFIFAVYFVVKVEWMNLVLLYVGLMMFVPVGMIIGWAFLDPYMRCKLIRRATKRNYGIVNFCGKGQKIVSKIKNFDDSLIWRGNSVWAITKEHIYQLSKNGDNLVETGKIDAESIVTLVETVPVLFVDLDSMQPLSLARDRREGINPLELGPALKSWVDNEKAKALGLKKNIDLYFVVIIICSVVAVGLAYLNMNNVNEMMGQIENIQSQLEVLLQNTTIP